MKKNYITILALFVSIIAVNAQNLWGVDASVDVANAEFQNNFIQTGVAGSYDINNWTALSINDTDGTNTPGVAYWTRNLLGYSQGAYWSNTTPVTSPSQSNGIAIFDSDFMDNTGNAGAHRTGTSPATHKGELISPRIDLTGSINIPLAVKFYSYYRNFQMNELSVSFSVDDGSTWGTAIDYKSLQSGMTAGFLTAVLPANSTQGVSNLTECRIKFTFDGEYYFAIVDDVTIIVADLTPPVFENSTPSSASIGDAGFTINTDIDEAGTIYYVVVADGATAPTSVEVKAGTASGGGGAVKSGNASVTSGGFTDAFSVTGLTAGTAYDVYVVAQDDEWTPNLQAAPTKIDVETTINTVPTFTSTAIITINEGDTYNYIVITNDVDGDNVTITAPTKPSWLTLATSSTVSTLAGNGLEGFANGTGTSAQFNKPYGIAVDGSGNVYVADNTNHSIRKINSAGVVTTLAGSGVAGFVNGTGAAAQFNGPSSVAVDALGNVYVADVENHRIRKISSSGVVTTLAGSTSGFADGTGIAARFKYPSGVAVDGLGNVYVSDRYNHSIRKISPIGVVTTLAGSGVVGFTEATGTAAQFNEPAGLTVDGSGNVYVADTRNHRIRKISPTGVVTTLAGSLNGFANGTGTAAQFSYPASAAVDGLGNVYVTSNGRIRKISPTGVVTTLAGSGAFGFADGASTAAQFKAPYGIAVDGSGTVYVGDLLNERIRKITQKTVLTGTANATNVGNHNVVLEANDGNGGIVNQNFTITVNDVTSPTVIDVLTSSSADNKTYGVGDKISIYVQFTESVAVTGTPQLTLETGATDRTINYKATSSSIVEFEYTVQSGDESADLGYVAINSLKLNDGTIKDAAGNNAVLTLPTPGASGSLDKERNIIINASVPTITTTNASSVAQLSVTLGGNVTDGGGSTVTERGIVYSIMSINTDPLIEGTGVTQDTNDTGTGIFSESITGLQPNTQYSFKAYATNNSGTVYGNVNTFTTLALVTPTITFANVSKIYGDASFNLAATSNSSGTISYSIVSGLTASAFLSGVNNKTVTIGNAGTITIRASQVANGIYAASSTDVTLKVNKATLTTTANDKSREYGDVNPAFTISYSGFKGSDSVADIDAAPVANSTATSTTNVGTAAITLSGGSDTNYTITPTNGILTISKAPLIVTAQNTTVGYGDNFSIDFEYGVFKNGEDASVLDAGAYVYIDGTFPFNVGTYPIVPDAVDDNNYAASYVNGTLTVNKASLIAIADDKSRQYGDANPTLTFTYSGFKNNETSSVIDTEPTATTSATTATNVGTATISVSDGSDTNYTISYTSGILTIGKESLTANAIYKTKIYGDENPAFDILYSGFKNGETASVLDTAPIASCVATTSTSVGSETIDVSAGTDTNYTINSIAGILTIDKATLTATADDKTKVFGKENPAFTISYTGFKNGETAAILDTAPSASSTATVSTPAGNVSIDVSTGTDANYTIISVNGILTILADTDGDGISDDVDDDDDNDGVLDVDDNSYLPNPDQLDTDGDGLADVEEDCDNDGIVNYYDTDVASCQDTIVMKDKYGFSPNGDGVNDTWVIEDIQLFPNNVVHVYNRSGKMVYTMKGYDNSFNGFSNKVSSGKKLPVGAYYFTVEFNTPGAKPAKGWIYINY